MARDDVQNPLGELGDVLEEAATLVQRTLQQFDALAMQEALSQDFAASKTISVTGTFAEMQEVYEQVAPDPGHFDAFAARLSAIVQSHPGWTDDDLRSSAAPVLLVIGDTDFVRIEHAAEVLALIPDAQLAVLPATRHTEIFHRTDVLVPLLERFLHRDAEPPH